MTRGLASSRPVSPADPPEDRPALEVVDARKRFGAVRAVDGVSVDLGPHEVLALVGPSGCGKSTLLRMVAGLVPADSGRVVVGGRVVEDGRSHVPPERRRVGLVFQDHSLFPHLTVEANVGFGVRDGTRRERARRVAETLDLVDLAGYGRRYPHELSGGQRQRVAVARALAPQPGLLLLDEPFGSLDHNLRVQIREQVRTVLRETATPAVVVTHDQHEALALGDRIGVLREGRLVQVGTPDVVFHQPVDRFVGAFLGEASFLALDGGPSGRGGGGGPEGRARTALGDLDAGASDGHVAMVRPDDVQFAPDPDGDAQVVAASYRGAHWLYTVTVTGSATVLVEGSHLTPHAVGTRGRVSLTPGHEQVVVADV